MAVENAEIDITNMYDYKCIHTYWKKFSSDKPFNYNILLRQELEIYSQPTMPAADDDRAQQLPGMEPKVIAIST